MKDLQSIEDTARLLGTDVETVLSLIGIGAVDVVQPCADVRYATVDVSVARAALETHRLDLEAAEDDAIDYLVTHSRCCVGCDDECEE